MQPLTEPPQIWEAVATDRALLAEWAGRWPDSVWERPTPCAGWTVRQVLGHVTSMATASKARTLVTYLRSGANWDRASNMLAAAASEAGSNDDVIGRLRSNAASRHAPPGLRANGVLAELVAHIKDL
ncbi:MAG: maleylpyruvate isomerase N-terminal domain-containing protein [Actinomycetes bacterium]